MRPIVSAGDRNGRIRVEYLPSGGDALCEFSTPEVSSPPLPGLCRNLWLSVFKMTGRSELVVSFERMRPSAPNTFET